MANSNEFYNLCKELFYLMDDIEIYGFDKYEFLKFVIEQEKNIPDDDMTPEEKTQYISEKDIHKNFT
ncbi:MAG: hypothetical protein UH854_05400 [Clostridia bacterium]|nr:hypothetical protein [Clostridia bacterium]